MLTIKKEIACYIVRKMKIINVAIYNNNSNKDMFYKSYTK